MTNKSARRGIVDPRDLTKPGSQPDYDELDASDEAALSKRMKRDGTAKGESKSARPAARKGAISRVSKSSADQPRRKTRGGTGPR
jgi:hypothetical protein